MERVELRKIKQKLHKVIIDTIELSDLTEEEREKAYNYTKELAEQELSGF